ncbi:unnamed protein product [Arabidopsis halleri]
MARIRPSWYRESPPKQPSFSFEPEAEDDVVVLPPVDNSALLSRLQLSLVGRMFHRGGRSIEALVSLLPKENIWDVEGRARGVSLGDSRFQFFFKTEADLLKILNKRPCHFNKWSFALERWQPHIGISFPATMTFWIKLEGIPSEFWVEELLRNFGNSFGTTHRVDTTNGRIQVAVQADAPLRFNKLAQLPTGEVVKVKLFYEKLFRWCVHCRRICHEYDSCPLLDANQRATLAASLGGMGSCNAMVVRDLAPSGDKRKDKGLLALPASDSRDGKNRLYHPTARASSQRYPNNRNSDSYRSSQSLKLSAPLHTILHQATEPLAAKEKTMEDGRKRRYADSSGPESKDVRRTERRSGGTPAVSDSQRTISDPLQPPLKAKHGTDGSPSNSRDRPFRLNFSRKLTTEEKGKGKVSNIPEQATGDSSETGSSAKKSLNFDSQAPVLETVRPETLFSPSNHASQPEKKKSWFEITKEEEAKERNEDPEAFLAKQFSQAVSFASPALRRSIPDPSLNVAEKEWLGNPSAMSEALNRDWTAEDQEAFNALESPRFSDEENLIGEEDDLLGDELADVLPASRAGASNPQLTVAPNSHDVLT